MARQVRTVISPRIIADLDEMLEASRLSHYSQLIVLLVSQHKQEFLARYSHSPTPPLPHSPAPPLKTQSPPPKPKFAEPIEF